MARGVPRIHARIENNGLNLLKTVAGASIYQEASTSTSPAISVIKARKVKWLSTAPDEQNNGEKKPRRSPVDEGACR